MFADGVARMRLRPLLAALLLVPFAAASASAEWWGPVQGNDTGGIIAWSPAIEPDFRLIATDHCARFNKVPVITSVHRVYGDYIGFRCYFPRGYDPRKGVMASRVLRTLY
jgi:hypothetical protein